MDLYDLAACAGQTSEELDKQEQRILSILTAHERNHVPSMVWRRASNEYSPASRVQALDLLRSIIAQPAHIIKRRIAKYTKFYTENNDLDF
jgi:hypothetical protein